MASKFGSSLIRFILLRIPQFWHQVLVLQDGVRWGRGWFETVSSPGGCGQTSEAVKSCWIRSPAPASPLADWMKQPPRDVGSSDAQIKLRGGEGVFRNNLLFIVRSGRLRTTSTMTVVQNWWLLLFSLVLQAFSSKNTYFSYFSPLSYPFNFT